MARVLGDDHYKFMTRITVGVTLKNSQEGRKNPKQTNKQTKIFDSFYEKYFKEL